MEGERRRCQRECNILISNAKQIESTTKDRILEMEKQAHNSMLQIKYDQDKLDIKKEEINQLLKQVAAERSKLQVEVELFKPRKSELEAKICINENILTNIKTKELNMIERENDFEKQKLLLDSNFTKLNNFENELKQKNNLIEIETSELKNEISKIMKRDQLLNNEYNKLKWMEQDIHSSVNVLNDGMMLLQKFEKALILKAKLDITKQNSDNIHNKENVTHNLVDHKALSLVQQASYTGALEKDLNDILSNIEHKMNQFKHDSYSFSHHPEEIYSNNQVEYSDDITLSRYNVDWIDERREMFAHTSPPHLTEYHPSYTRPFTTNVAILHKPYLPPQNNSSDLEGSSDKNRESITHNYSSVNTVSSENALDVTSASSPSHDLAGSEQSSSLMSRLEKLRKVDIASQSTTEMLSKTKEFSGASTWSAMESMRNAVFSD